MYGDLISSKLLDHEHQSLDMGLSILTLNAAWSEISWVAVGSHMIILVIRAPAAIKQEVPGLIPGGCPGVFHGWLILMLMG